MDTGGVNLKGNGVGDKGALGLGEGLKRNTGLLRLNLQRNRIGAEGARALAEGLVENRVLRHFDLECNSVDAHGARALLDACLRGKSKNDAASSSLQYLSLARNQLGGGGGSRALAYCLEEFMEFHTAFKELNLEHNSIDAHEAEFLRRPLEAAHCAVRN